MSTILRRIGERQWSVISDIARQEGREPKNVLDLVIDRGLAARAQPTLVTYHRGAKQSEC